MTKTGMNLLLWTTHVTEQHDAILDQIKEMGFDAVEVPIFDTADLAPFERLGKRHQGPRPGRDGRDRDGRRDQSDLARCRRSATPPWRTSTG